MYGIEVKNVTKKFGATCALDNVSLSFSGNKIYGLLGRNGAGKSTLLNIISNRLFADAGKVTIDGQEATENDRAQGKLYVMSEKTYYPDHMKIKKIFTWTKNFYPDFNESGAMKMSRQFGLDTDHSVRSLSTGYRSIFKLIIALNVKTPYVFLDEPVLGLDANHRELFYRILIEEYSLSPSTIVISTHLIEELSGLIEKVIIIDKGRVLKSESRDSLLSRGYTVTGSIQAVDTFIIGKEVIGTDILGGMKSAHIMGRLSEKLPAELEKSNLDLQKLFIQLTGKEGE